MSAQQTMETQQAQKGKEILEAVLSRSAVDMDFRRRLVADAPSAIAEYTGGERNAVLDIAFVENHADATIVLPPVIDTEAELRDEELEAVSGGTTPLCTAVALFEGACILVGAAAFVIDKCTGSDSK